MDEQIDIHALGRGTIKAYLQASGSQVFKSFCARRTALECGGQLTVDEAHRTAVEEFRAHIETGSQLEKERAAVPRGTAPTKGLEGFLCSKDDFEDVEACGSVQSVAWVFDNLALRDLQPSDAPSPGAWGLVCWVRETPGNRTEFYRTIWPKLLPSRTQIDDGADWRDDGRKQLSEIDQILRYADDEAQVTADNKTAQTVEQTPELATIGKTEDTGGEPDEGWDA